MEAMISRHRGSLVAGTAFAIVVLFLAAVIASITIDEPAGGEALDASGDIVPDDTTPIQPPFDLAPLIAPAPPGFDRTVPPLDGQATAEALANTRENPGSTLALFEKLGFQAGYVRTWQRSGSDDLVAVRLYLFGRASAASRFTELSVAARTGPTSKRFDVPGVPGAVGLDIGVERIPPDPNVAGVNRNVAFIFVPKGRVAAIVAFSGAQPPDTAMLASVARAQVALLP